MVIDVLSATPSIAQEEQTGFFDSAGQRVRYRVRGDGPPLLMIHGIGAPLEFWRPLEPKLEDFRTITVDPPGAGRSSTPEGRFRMRDFAEVMGDLLTHLELDSANVLGLSLGGMMAQELAHRSPERVEKLVLASTSCCWSANPMAMAVVAAPARFFSREQAEELTAAQHEQQLDRGPSLLRIQAELLRHYRPSGRGYFLQLRAALTWSSRAWLSKLEMPVLAIAGSDDLLVPMANSRIIASGVRHGRLEIIPGGGHLCLLKESDHTSQLIRDFLQDDFGRGR